MMVNAKRRYKIWMFLASYTAFTMSDLLNGVAMFHSETSLERLMIQLDKSMTVIFFGVCFIILRTMDKRQTFRQSKAMKFLMLGVFMWLIWGAFISVGGLAVFTSSKSFTRLIRIGMLILSMFMAVKIVYVYNLIKPLVGIKLFMLGTMMLAAYVINFNGLEFLDAIGNILARSGRYRVSFGLTHPNTAGRLCLEFFMFKALYARLL